MFELTLRVAWGVFTSSQLMASAQQHSCEGINFIKLLFKQTLLNALNWITSNYSNKYQLNLKTSFYFWSLISTRWVCFLDISSVPDVLVSGIVNWKSREGKNALEVTTRELSKSSWTRIIILEKNIDIWLMVSWTKNIYKC